jgi:hypothetical protein
MSVFHRLLLEKGTNPFRLAVCPTDMTLQARLPLPVPSPAPSEPPVFPVGLDTPEQAVKNSAMAKSADRKTSGFQAEQGRRIVQQLSASLAMAGKRPLGHVRILKTS